MSQFWSDFVHTLKPYVPGEQPAAGQALVKLNTNENPFGPSPRVLAALQAKLDDSLRLYPDPESRQLRGAIAACFGVDAGQVFVGNGSDEILAHVFNGLLRHAEPILLPQVSYSFYPVYCQLFGIERVEIPLDPDFRVAVSAYCQPNGGVVVANPNAPTGVCLALVEVEQLLQQNADSVVVIDEAYIDFGGDSAIALVDRYPNLLVVQTLSKSRSLAGLRVGFAVGQRDLIDALERVKNSFNSYPLDTLAQVAAQVAIEDSDWFEQCRERVISNRQALTHGLQDYGFEVLPSAANFVFARHPGHDAATLLEALRQHGVIVRHFPQPVVIAQFLRISVGTVGQQDALFSALAQILAGPRR
jgi:histidinol-phosphate aminotransferase